MFFLDRLAKFADPFSIRRGFLGTRDTLHPFVEKADLPARRHHPPLALLTVLLVALSATAQWENADPDATVLIPLVPADPEEPPTETPPAESQPAELDPRRLLAKLHRTEPGSEEYHRLAESLLSTGPKTAPQLLARLHSDADRLRMQYLRRVHDLAGQALKQRWNRQTLAEAKRLRHTLLTTARKPDLTKDLIVATSDPAREKLNSLYLGDAEPLLERNDPLRNQRKTLLALAELTHRAWRALDANRRKRIEAPPNRHEAEAQLLADEELTLLLASPMPSSDRAVIRRNRKLAEKLLPREARGVLLLNRLRTRLGLRALTIDLRMQAAARDHSRDMAEHDFFSHTSPLPGKTRPEDRGRRAGTTIHGENIHHGSDDPQSALLGWWHSPGHHKNLLQASFRRVGVGYHALYWTQNFGR